MRVPGRWIGTGLQVIFYLASLTGCVGAAIPIPWFPENPHYLRIDRLETVELDRQAVVQQLGPPWVTLGDESFVYIASATGSKVIWFVGSYGGDGDAGIINASERDYALVVHFDESGKVRNFETFNDSFRHDHCFENGICFKPESLNVPLAPAAHDQEAKTFRSLRDRCALYLYRDSEGPGMSSEDYAEIAIGDRNARFKKEILGVSVEGGYHRWNLPPADSLRVYALYRGELGFPFETDNHAKARDPDRFELSCTAGEVKFLRHYVARSDKHGTRLEMVDETTGRQAIGDLDLLLQNYRP